MYIEAEKTTPSLGNKGHGKFAKLVLTLILREILTSFDPSTDPDF